MTLLLQLSRIMVVLKVTVYSSEIFEKVKDVIEQLIKVDFIHVLYGKNVNNKVTEREYIKWLIKNLKR